MEGTSLVSSAVTEVDGASVSRDSNSFVFSLSFLFLRFGRANELIRSITVELVSPRFVGSVDTDGAKEVLGDTVGEVDMLGWNDMDGMVDG